MQILLQVIPFNIHLHGPFILLIIGFHCTFKLCHSLRAHSHLRWIHLKGIPFKTHSHVIFILPTIGFQSTFTFKTHSYSDFSFKDTFTCANYNIISFFFCKDTFTFRLFLSRYIQTVHLYYQILAFIAHSSLAIDIANYWFSLHFQALIFFKDTLTFKMNSQTHSHVTFILPTIGFHI
jgi:hypothetical protein